MSKRLEQAEGILAWLECAGVGIRLTPTGPKLAFPSPPDPDIEVNKVLEEIKPFRQELIALLQRDIPVHIAAAEWRQYVVRWPVKMRKAWGERAVALEDEGLNWHEAEKRAFEEVSEQFRTPTGRQ